MLAAFTIVTMVAMDTNIMFDFVGTIITFVMSSEVFHFSDTSYFV
jgi:hypothetical protein